MSVRLVLAAFGAFVLAGCSAQHVSLPHRRVTDAGWKAVLKDWYDGKLSDRHSCAEVIVAASHLPVDPPIYSTVVSDLAHYAARVCTHHGDASAVRIGMTDDDVARLAGAPHLPLSGRCWDYPSRTVCFTNGRVAEAVARS